MSTGHQNPAVREAVARLAQQQTDRAAVDHGSIARHEDATVSLSQTQVTPCDPAQATLKWVA
jgi:hypothetical protein